MTPMKWLLSVCTLIGLLAVDSGPLSAQTLWDRRDQNMSTLFHDYRARNVGDVLTVFIEETTGFDAQEKRELDKKTSSDFTFNGTGSTSGLSGVLRSFGYALDINNASARTFAGNNNSSIDRKFTDRMSFTVVYVMPNGNLIVEGYRQRLITREMRTLRLQGIVRPADIGPYNTVHSQFIGDLRILYEGKGPESSYTNQNYGGRLFNKLWPF
jgi:flagellar L-ring protein precursor FlgH